MMRVMLAVIKKKMIERVKMISPTNLVKYFEGLHQRFRVDFIRVLLTHHLKEIFLFLNNQDYYECKTVY